jgi:superfamily II DNA/RNA helicase
MASSRKPSSPSRQRGKKTASPYRHKHTVSKGKKKVLLKKKRGEIKFRKKQGEPSFDLTRLINKSFGEAKLAKIKSPIARFSEIPLDARIQNNLKKKDFRHPSPIQGMTIPPILEGRDVIGIANTGTGKTAAFVLPILDLLLKNPKQKTLIIAPTRELAEQIDRETKLFGEGLPFHTALCIGGKFLEGQFRKLARGPQFVIGTPGRLLDLSERKKIDFSQYGVIVLDEMDRMLDMGFLKDIKKILLHAPEKRQTLLFSATMPKTIREIAGQFLHNPLEFVVKPRSTSRNVEQNVIRLHPKDSKIEKLHELLLDRDFNKVIIFGRTKRGVEHLARELMSRGFKADAIHGDKSQSQRKRALRRFTQDEISVLVATDVAARGLDIPDVTHVINYDIPETYDDYVHRIGRTGRADKAGTALTFVDADFDK